MLANCILYYNTAPNEPNFFGSTMTYSCSTPMPSGMGNITNAPLFKNTNGWTNLRLESNSPCINAGNNACMYASTDLAGNPRIAGGTVDLGTYEFQGAGLGGLQGWLWGYGLRVDGTADSVDSDGDGLSNLAEWRCGTVPTNAGSVLKLLAPQTEGKNVLVQWLSVSGINYFLERSTNLSGAPAFRPLATKYGGAGMTGFTDTNAPMGGQIFYRIGVEK
jgi:hypothetical protein